MPLIKLPKKFPPKKKPIRGYKLKPDSRLTAAWMFDTEAADMRDLTGRGNTAVKSGTPVLVSSPHERSLQFDGATDLYTISDHADVDPTTNDFTIVLSVTSREINQDAEIFEKQGSSPNSRYQLIANWSGGGNNYSYLIRSEGSSATAGSSTTVAVGERVHIVCRRQAGFVSIWINGIVEADTSESLGSLASNVDLTLGFGSSGYYDGEIHYMRMYQGYVDDQEIKAWARDEYNSWLEPDTDDVYFTPTPSVGGGSIPLFMHHYMHRLKG